MLKPLSDFVVVTVQKTERKTDSGIFLADTSAAEPVKKGLVVAVGKNVEDVKDMQFVLFPKECGVTVKHKGEDYIILNKNNILAVVKDG